MNFYMNPLVNVNLGEVTYLNPTCVVVNSEQSINNTESEHFLISSIQKTERFVKFLFRDIFLNEYSL